MDSDSSTELEVKFALSISADRNNFLRRSCDSCGRYFKTEIESADLQWALSEQVRRLGAEIGEEPDNARDKLAPPLHCPYCAHEASMSEMHTEETTNYLRRLVYQDYILPLLNKMFAGLENDFRGQGQTGGMFSVSLRFEHHRASSPCRPIHGPEPADMKIVEFLCCGKRVKLSEHWYDVSECPFCRTGVVIT